MSEHQVGLRWGLLTLPVGQREKKADLINQARENGGSQS